LVKIIHEPPSLHGFNRTTWTLKTLSAAYQKVHGEVVSRSMVSQYFKELGYKFKRARKVLTSPDPEYRTKLKQITKILSRLGPREKFFSIDEFGPCAVKRRGGVALVPADEIRTIPQRQRSKGSLICTAALELSTNQVTHFYSKRKNTAEMIKMLETLVAKYRDQDQIYLSWDDRDRLGRQPDSRDATVRDDTGGVRKRGLWKRLNGHGQRKRRNSQAFP
jgi:hypothetical protein